MMLKASRILKEPLTHKTQDSGSNEGRAEKQPAWGLSSVFILVLFAAVVNSATCREVSLCLCNPPKERLEKPSLK